MTSENEMSNLAGLSATARQCGSRSRWQGMLPLASDRVTAFVAMLIFSSFYSVHAALAAWPGDPATNVPVCTAIRNQIGAQIVSDGAGGAIVAWQDDRASTQDIYVQHVQSTGEVNPNWPLNGRVVFSNPGWPLGGLKIVSDGAGGAIVTWWLRRSGFYDIYAQHVLSGGNVDSRWPTNGRAVCTASGDQDEARIVSDGAGAYFGHREHSDRSIVNTQIGIVNTGIGDHERSEATLGVQASS